MNQETPLMRQYHAIKQQHADTLLMFQVGDFYELFFDDAKRAAAFLGIALTKRGKNAQGEPIPLCGVPVHALDHYITKLIRGGFKVALCDQLQQAVPGKVVERGVTRVLTPGTLTESALLDEKTASYLCAFFPLETSWGLIFGELLTAQLHGTVIPAGNDKVLETELVRFFPDEVLLPDSAQQFGQQFKQHGYFVSYIDSKVDAAIYNQWTEKLTLESRAQLAQHEALQKAVQTFYAYMRKTNEAALTQFNNVRWYDSQEFLRLDAATQRNLELVKNSYQATRQHTLYAALDGAVTPMGSRMIKKWILSPLVDVQAIMQRQDVVQECITDVAFAQRLRAFLKGLSDLERVVGRIALRRATLADYLHLKEVLTLVPHIRQLLAFKQHMPIVQVVTESITDFGHLEDLLERALNDDITKEWQIKTGFDESLDRIRSLVATSNHAILELEAREQQATGIPSLKIRHNGPHGYAIEITKTHFAAVPAHYIRRQTLVGRERFTMPELQALEYEIIKAHAEIESREQQVFESVKQEVVQYITRLRRLAHALAYTDALLGLASVAYEHKYVRPVLTTTRDMIITHGRHPVVEQTLGRQFIPNDTQLTDQQSLWIITGPNMGGKSTYLRQVGLMAIMAQCGSFVPAEYAQMPIFDRIFTRIGAGDNLVEGKSTFMVEMEETATICTLATNKSLVILDEVGRGTSTFDGLAIAQAVVEYLHTTIKARCLFATHYHELTNLENTIAGIVSYYAASKKTSHGIVFLYKMVRGIADGSFGVEVAKKAALPHAVIERAESLLAQFTDSSYEQLKRLPAHTTQQPPSITAGQQEVLRHIAELDCDSLSPRQALDILCSMRECIERT